MHLKFMDFIPNGVCAFCVCLLTAVSSLAAYGAELDRDEPRQTKMNNGDVVLVSSEQEPPTVWCNGTQIYTDDKVKSFVVDVIGSNNHSSLLCLVAQGSLRAFSFDHLLWIHRTNASQGWTVEKLFERNQIQTRLAGKIFVSEMGAIDDTNPIALLKVGEQTAKEAPFRVKYSWQTWDIVHLRLLGEGLRIENANRSDQGEDGMEKRSALTIDTLPMTPYPVNQYQ